MVQQRADNPAGVRWPGAMENEQSENSTLRASAFVPQSNGRFVAGALMIEHEAVHFQSESGSVSMPMDGLQMRLGGHNNEQIFFEHSNAPGWSIFSSDARLPKHPVLLKHPEFWQKLRSLDRSRSATPLPVKLGVLLALLLLAGLISLFMARDRIVEYIVQKVPLSWEQSLGAQVFEQVKAEGKLVLGSEWEPRVKSITKHLLPIVEDSGMEFRFHIQQDTNINAFAIPGGDIIILTGLLETAESAEEVAGVLAHEIAHVTKRHSSRNLIKSAGLIVMIQALLGDQSGAIGALAEGSSVLLRQRFSRDFEREADDTGWEYLVEANIDPRGMTAFFRRLTQESPIATSLSLLNTHPAPAERIDRLERKWDAMERKSGFLQFDKWPN